MDNKLTSIDLAKLCGVSQGTVDRALNNRPGISQKTKEKILKIAGEIGYFPDIHAGKLAGGKSRLIGLVVFDLKNGYFSELIYSVDMYCRSIGYALITMFSGKDRETELLCVKRLVSIGVDGLIICGVNNGAELKKIIPDSTTTVAVGNHLDGFAFCGLDDFAAMKELCDIASSNGHSPVYYSPAMANIRGDNISAQQMRYDGYVASVGEEASSLCTSMDELKIRLRGCKKGFPAVVCSTDYYALQVFGEFKDVELYSFDKTGVLHMINKSLVSVGVSADKVAENAVKIITEKTDSDMIIPHEIQSFE